jgi:hypothetical protein
MEEYDAAAAAEEEYGAPAPASTSTSTTSPNVRYWSDFNRVVYASRSLQRLPDIADWERTDGNWAAGKDAFGRYDAVSRACTAEIRGRMTELTLGLG